jgi:hypothetical protein
MQIDAVLKCTFAKYCTRHHTLKGQRIGAKYTTIEYF